MIGFTECCGRLLQVVVFFGFFVAGASEAQLVTGNSSESAQPEQHTLDLSGNWTFYGAGCDATIKIQALKIKIEHQGNLLSITLDDECKDNKWYTGSTWITGQLAEGYEEGAMFTLNALVYNKRNGSVTKSTVLSSYLQDNGNLIIAQSSNWRYVRYFYRSN